MKRLYFVVAILLLFTAPLARADAKPERGIASMYATSFVGQPTASGELLDSQRMTAAHKYLPFGTKVEVLNKRNGRKVIVTVNDRGPHVRGRVIDLSPAAARVLGMQRAGVVPVEVRLATRIILPGRKP
jgi:rare lipoprotein A